MDESNDRGILPRQDLSENKRQAAHQRENTMSSKLDVGVIGVGTFGSLHAKVYAESGEAELIAVADVNLARAQEIGERHGVAFYSDYNELLARPDIEAVSICTTDEQHVAPCVAAAEAGKHILVEKPLATAVSDCDTILRATREAGVHLMVGHILRFDPRYHTARQAVVERQLGDVVYLYGRRDGLITGAERLEQNTSVLFFLGIHDLDFMNWCVGSKAERVYAESVQKRLTHAPDLTCALIRFTNGAVAALETTWILPETYVGRLDAEVKVMGTRGVVHVDGSGWSVGIYTEDKAWCPNVHYTPTIHGRTMGILKDEIDHFVDCVRRDQPPMVTGEDGKAAVELACAIAESAQQGAPVYLA